jgi:LysM repeat protein
LDVYLKNEKNKEEFHFPVNPIDKIAIKRSKKYETVDIIDFGEADIPSLGKNIKELGFDTLLPNQYYSFCRYRSIPDVDETVSKLEKWMNQKEPVRLIITGFNFNELVIISDFTIEERVGESKDKYISIAFRLYRELKVEALPPPVNPPKPPPQIDSNPTTRTMIVTVGNSRLNVRSGPGTNYSIIGKLYSGNEVKVYEIKNSWALISYTKGKDSKAYVSAKYLKDKPTSPPLNSRPSSNSGKKMHVVKKGDSLWAISKKYYGSGSKWSNIYNVPENKKTIGSNPNIIRPGQKIIIP